MHHCGSRNCEVMYPALYRDLMGQAVPDPKMQNKLERRSEFARRIHYQ